MPERAVRRNIYKTSTRRGRKSSSKASEDTKPKIVCIWCGCDDQKRFYVTRDNHRKFFGKIPYCKTCIQKIYEEKLARYNGNNDLAMYYTLRKIDVPYIHTVYTGAFDDVTNPKSNMYGMENLVGAYMKGLSFSEMNGWGYSFDDSRGENEIEGLTSYDEIIKVKRHVHGGSSSNISDYDIVELDSQDLIQKWGQFDDDDLAFLESEYMDWDEYLNGISDKSTDIMIKQVCLQLNEIRKDRQEGVSVEKKVATLQSLMKSSGLSDIKNGEDQPQSVGMSIRDIEFKRPLKEVDPELADVDNVRLILDAYLGGTSRAVGKENEFTRRFDEEYSKYTIDIIDNLKQQYSPNSESTTEDDSDGDSNE